ncbi:hypothetical protein HG536_0C03760 [Torulaspora globosa]|uniref:Telomerase reverse transcriptase n=1 Tax=Torulaspora globosa TaxID=48254 RepID=A0A7G3ZFC1_9SACH|nr:uncharacterized protein HG536_0C03760 [Torulaspora globosa]QLL32207.1 hypothetical protein HG536_0C03760 [Torulaspora globosa]
MKCLESYLKDDLKIDFASLQGQETYACKHFNGLSELLLRCYVYPNERQLPLPAFSEADNHSFVVDQCISFLLSQKFYSNLLTYGYRMGSNQNIGSALHCVDVNSCVAVIKSVPWQLFRDVFGTQQFANLIVNHSLFLYNEEYFSQVSGDRINSSYCLPPSRLGKLEDRLNDFDAPFKVASFLYKNSFGFKHKRILPSRKGYLFLRESLTQGCPVRISGIIVRQMDAALLRLLRRHHGGIKYLQIFNNLCPKPKSNNHLDAQTPTDHVLRFLIVVLEKLVTDELFGSKRNKAAVFKYVSKILKLPIRGSLYIEEIAACLKVKDFQVFRPPSSLFSRHDFEAANFLMRSFVSWLFKTVIPAIISTFFYCTEISSFTTTLFFRQDIWNEMSLPFLQNYLDNFMVENTKCRNHESYTLSKFNHHKVRIIPKKSKGEFRVIAIPMKGADSEEFKDFQQNFRNVICPVQCVLEFLRSRRKTHFGKLYSVNQIGTHLGKFKASLLNKYGEVPKLHYLKFDINSCYDFIPREKVLSVIRKALMNDCGFFVRSQSYYDTRKGILRIRNVVNGCRKPKKEEVYIDNVRTFFVSADDLIHTVMTELFQSALSFNGKCYLRKTGLFQGTSLSALLVDLVYDELLEHYDIFHSSKEDDTIVLRLADDFLVLSTSGSRIARAREEVLNGFTEFNAEVKRSKLISSVSKELNQKLSFCALDINIRTLEISKSAGSLVVSDIQKTTTGKLYKKLLNMFEAKLSYGTASLLINSPATILNQLELIASNIAESLVRSFKKKEVKSASFSIFFERVTAAAIRSYREFGNDDVFILQIQIAIANGFLAMLSKRCVKFQDIVKFLQCYSVELLRTKISNR